MEQHLGIILALCAVLVIALWIHFKPTLSLTDKYSWDIDPSKPIFIIKGKYQTRYCHMIGPKLATDHWYPTERCIESWRIEYNLDKAEQYKFGLAMHLYPDFDEWVKTKHLYPDALYKAMAPPDLSHPCEVYYDSPPEHTYNTDYCLKLVKERYPQHFSL